MNLLFSLVAGKYAKIFWPSLVLILAFIYVKGLKSDIKDLRYANQTLNQELIIRKQEYEGNILTLKQSVERQNALIKQLNTQKEVAEREAEVKITEAEVKNKLLSKKLEDQIKLLDKVKTPQTCQEAIDFMVDVAIEYKWPTKEEE